MTEPEFTQQSRIILFHKHPTSARTRFLRFAQDTVCGFSTLPKLSVVVDDAQALSRPVLQTHPSVLLKETVLRLKLPGDAVELEPDYGMWVEAPGGAIRILLGRFTAIDPPFQAAEAIGARFIDLTQARDLATVELLLLRRAYEVILGG